VVGPPIKPMLAVTAPLPAGPEWAYELKWDGIRAIAEINDGVPRLYARSGTDVTTAYPELTGTVPAAFLPGSCRPADAVFDGEIVVLDAAGRPSFTALAERMHVRDAARARRLAGTVPVTFMVFDVLRLNGVDLCGRPYAERRETLERLDLPDPRWYVPPVFDDGEATVAAAQENGLEGVVAKRLAAPYRSGIRSPDWVKVKREQTVEVVVGGWRPGQGTRILGAMLVGVPRGDGTLDYRGRVGGGLSAASERRLLDLLAPLATPDPPFAEPLPRDDARSARWVIPELVIEVAFGNVTPDGRLRFPRFRRLRADLTPDEVSDA